MRATAYVLLVELSEQRIPGGIPTRGGQVIMFSEQRGDVWSPARGAPSPMFGHTDVFTLRPGSIVVAVRSSKMTNSEEVVMTRDSQYELKP